MRKRTKRKMWRLVDPIAHAIAGAAITDKASLDKLLIRELASIDAIARGLGTKQEWQDLVDVLNICETMAKGGIGPEALPYCQQAQEALYEAAKRYEKVHKIGLSGLGLQAMKEVIEYHHLQRTSIPRSEYEFWIQKTRNKIMSKNKDVVELV